MLNPDRTIAWFNDHQAGKLPDRFGFRVTSIEEGRMTASMTIEPWMLAPNGYLHAASVVMLADSAAGYATMAHLPEGAKGFTTVELKSNFLGTALEGTLTCDCVADHLGRQTHVWSATVFDPNGRKMALFRCTQMILRDKR